MNRETLLALADRLDAGEESDALDVSAALALNWRVRRVTRLGLNGRTPGSDRWFPPDETWGMRGSAKPPHFSGPRKRRATAASLRALSKGNPHDQ